jgi:hypothetical protein
MQMLSASKKTKKKTRRFLLFVGFSLEIGWVNWGIFGVVKGEGVVE